ncbi:MAG: hypothetical protein ACRDYA_12355 [Egibacteraceae bacterium]
MIPGESSEVVKPGRRRLLVAVRQRGSVVAERVGYRPVHEHHIDPQHGFVLESNPPRHDP